MKKIYATFKNVSIVLLLIIGLVMAIASQMGRSYRTETISNFTTATTLHSSFESGNVFMAELVFSTSIDEPVNIKLLDKDNRMHYQYQLPANGYKNIEIDWYSPELTIVFNDAPPVSGTVNVEYFF